MQLDHGNRRPPQRLPVNPRRHKVAPEQRKRVATACNSCNVRRIKCSGDRPCSQCASTARDCVYPVLVERVSVPKSELEHLRRQVQVYEKALEDVLPDPARRLELLHHVASPDSSSSSSPYAAAVGPSAASAISAIKTEPADNDSDGGRQVFSPGRLLQDADGMGRYVGETSGATFLDHLKELMSAAMPMTQPAAASADAGASFLSTLGCCITYDLRPIPSSPGREVNPLWLPPDDALAQALAELRHLIQDGAGQWPSGGIYWWGDLDALPLRPPLPSPSPSAPRPAGEADVGDYRHLAFYHVALAIACQGAATQPAAGPDAHAWPSEPYFSQAAMLLGNPLDVKRRTIGDVAALALMGFYLIETSRSDAAYMYVAAAMHTSIMLGAHRGWVDERGKRVFWSVYALDRWLSCLMGRPPTITDDAIQLPLPADAPSMPPAAGLRAHVELSRISGHVVGDTYHGSKAGGAAAGGAAGARQADSAVRMLEQWQSSLPPTLRLAGGGLSNDPAVCLMHMRYNQLLIVATRPLFFSAVKRAVAERLMAQPPAAAAATAGPSPRQQRRHLRRCMAAAVRNVRLVRHAMTFSRHRKLLHAGLHFVFNAAVCLILRGLLLAVVEPSSPPPPAEEGEQGERETDEGAAAGDTGGEVDFAIARMLDAAQAGNREAKKCAETLHDLRVLVGRLTAPPPPPPPPPLLPVPPVPIDEDPELYNELLTWMGDEWPPVCGADGGGYMAE